MSFGTSEPRLYDGFPSVTTVLSVLNKPALMPWAAKCTAEYILENYYDGCNLERLCMEAKRNYRSIGKDACNVGTAVHRAVELFLKGHGDDSVFAAMDEIEAETKIPEGFESKVMAGFSAFEEWYKDNEVEPVALEVEIRDTSHRYGGRVDFVGYVNGELTLIDFKTSKGFYDEMALQTAAYRGATPVNGEYSQLDIVANGVLRLDKLTGEPYYKDYSATYAIDYEMFILLADFYNALIARKKW